MVTILDLLKYHKELKIKPKVENYRWRLDCGIYMPIRFMTKDDIQDIQNKIDNRLLKVGSPAGFSGVGVPVWVEIEFCNMWSLMLHNELTKSDREADLLVGHACSLKHSYRYHWV